MANLTESDIQTKERHGNSMKVVILAGGFGTRTGRRERKPPKADGRDW